MATFGLTRQLSDGSRELNLYYCYCGDCDNGDNDINSGISKFVRLGCKCVLHYVCLIQYLRYKLGDRLTMSLNGISCPFGSECRSFKTLDEVEGDETLIYYITTDDFDNIVDYGINHSKLQEYLDENDCKPLTHEEVNDLRKWIDDQKTIEIIDPNVITDLFVLSTTKACPHCNVRSSHPHGHQCHHISPANPPKRGGCPNCHINYCYKCLSTEIENKRDRGGASNCLCNYWSNFCIPIKTSSDIKNFISINEGGIPFDKRCGCVICSDCKYNSPCSFCPGDCCVCKGYINPSPNEYIDINNKGQIKWKAEGPKLIVGDSNNYSLFDCCRHGYVEELILLLQKPNITDILNRQDSQGRTGLFLAIDANHIECVRLLLTKQEINVNLADRNGNVTPLNRACASNRIEVVRLLLTIKDIDVNASSRSTDFRHYRVSTNTTLTPLHTACINNFVEIVTLLLSHKDIAVNIPNGNKGITPLHYACSSGFSDIVSLLLSHKDIDTNCKDSHGLSPLCKACYEDNVETITVLLNHKDTNINLTDSTGKSPLNIVCSKRHGNGLECVRILLTHKDIDVNLPDKYGWTPFYNACSNGFSEHYIEIVALLLNHSNTFINVTDMQGLTPLNRACVAGCYEVTKLLLNHKDIDINLGDINDDTPLYNSYSKGYIEIQNLLLSHPSISISIHDCCSLGLADKLTAILQQPNITANDINKRDRGGRTGLYLACHANHIECVRLLLSSSSSKNIIDVNIADNHNVTPLNNCCNNGDTEIVSLLLNNNNINLNLYDNLYNACSNGFIEIIKLLLNHDDDDVIVDVRDLKINRHKKYEIIEILDEYTRSKHHRR